MSSRCPSCHRVLEEDAVCCAEVRHTWRCTRCSKLSQGFVVPYGKCYLCGGNIEVVEHYDVGDPARIFSIQAAVQIEVDTYYFYKLALPRMQDREGAEVLEELLEREQEHLKDLESNYHVKLDPKVLDPSEPAVRAIESELFSDLQLDASDTAQKIYEKAMELEARAARFYADRAKQLPEGTEKRICLELLAEEEEHIALLETELANLTRP